MIKLSRGYLSSSPLDINSQELTELTKSPNYNDYRSSARLSKRQSMHLTLKGSYNEVSLKRVELFVARRSSAKKGCFFHSAVQLLQLFLNTGIRRLELIWKYDLMSHWRNQTCEFFWEKCKMTWSLCPFCLFVVLSIEKKCSHLPGRNIVILCSEYCTIAPHLTRNKHFPDFPPRRAEQCRKGGTWKNKEQGLTRNIYFCGR